MPDSLPLLVDALIERVQSTALAENPGLVYVLHMPVSVALCLPDARTGVIESRVTETGQVSELKGIVYRGLEVVAWGPPDAAEQVTASPIASGETAAPVYVLDLLTGAIATR